MTTITQQDTTMTITPPAVAKPIISYELANNGVVTTIVPELAAEIGQNESLILMQVGHWIKISNNLREGKYWTYQSTTDMQKKAFPYLSISTINRAINKLHELGLIFISNFNTYKFDKTRWFALNEGAINALDSISISYQADLQVSQNEPPPTQNEPRRNQNEPPIPEESTESTTKNNKESKVLESSPNTNNPLVVQETDTDPDWTDFRNEFQVRLNDFTKYKASLAYERDRVGRSAFLEKVRYCFQKNDNIGSWNFVLTALSELPDKPLDRWHDPEAGTDTLTEHEARWRDTPPAVDTEYIRLLEQENQRNARLLARIGA